MHIVRFSMSIVDVGVGVSRSLGVSVQVPPMPHMAVAPAYAARWW